MKYVITNKDLLDLYKTGRGKKLKLPHDVIKKFFMRIQQIEAANDLYDFWKTPSIKFEKLKGYENRYSMKIDYAFRLEMEIEWENIEKTIGVFLIVEISKHYGE